MVTLRERLADAVRRAGGNEWLAADYLLEMAQQPTEEPTQIPPNTITTVTLTGEGVSWLQAAVATAGPTTIVRLAVTTEPWIGDGRDTAPGQTAAFKVDEGTWSPPFYATATYQRAYDVMGGEG